ncbi:YafY family transcriptional regulator [Brevibacillus humidisoli]|uniref:helix-turn-helix transcriptional regulator n=1 Tax=Brevibacillus humidisoli TaxID=2895522 RepID=UPI001E5A3547|nr:YafY family protein [Brevibacillus humidisoli]UFJ42590.1 YafY family transcriptional regulator [Brevibacillus humidisoli]
MSKSKRLIELMMTINRKRKFTTKELAAEFGVSVRTILRDLQELSELGVPLYSEVGPHGGYQVLHERMLPPIAFTEEEAVALFFACHALRHFSSLPFEAETNSALHKFFSYLPGDVKDRIDQMKNRVDLVQPTREQSTPYLSILLEAAIRQQIIQIEYDSRQGVSSRDIQPIGIYAKNGFWYCPAYCFARDDFRLFRADRIYSAAYSTSGLKPREFSAVNLANWESFVRKEQDWINLRVELSRDGVRRCQAELSPLPKLKIETDGTGILSGRIPRSEISYFAGFFMGLGKEAIVAEPAELVTQITQRMKEMIERYENHEEQTR